MNVVTQVESGEEAKEDAGSDEDLDGCRVSGVSSGVS